MTKVTKQPKQEIHFKVVEMNHFSEAAAAKFNKRLNEIALKYFTTTE